MRPGLQRIVSELHQDSPRIVWDGIRIAKGLPEDCKVLPRMPHDATRTAQVCKKDS